MGDCPNILEVTENCLVEWNWREDRPACLDTHVCIEFRGSGGNLEELGKVEKNSEPQTTYADRSSVSRLGRSLKERLDMADNKLPPLESNGCTTRKSTDNGLETSPIDMEDCLEVLPPGVAGDVTPNVADCSPAGS